MSTHSDGVARCRRLKQEWITEYKAARGCAVCGEPDPVVLDLDHVNPDTKDDRLRRRNVTTKRARWGLAAMSWVDLVAELELCQVLCANCHRRKTWAERQPEHVTC